MKRRGRSTRTGRRIYRRRGGLWIVLLLAALAAFRWWQDQSRPTAPESLSGETFRVERVVDGDTLLLANQARVRLIGVDTPETVKPNTPRQPFGPEAAEFTRVFTQAGEVRLQFDRERVDRYGRFLAYVWVENKMLNEELLRAGLATAEMQYDYSPSMKTRFRRAEEEAKQARQGIWSLPAETGR